MKDNNDIIKNLKKNSIGDNKKVMLKNINYKKLTVVSVLSLTIAFSALSGYINHIKYKDINEHPTVTEEHNYSNRDYIYTYNRKIVDNMLYVEQKNIRIKLVINGVNTTKNNENNIVNTIEDYQKIEDLNQEDLIGFYNLTKRDKLETEKMIKALGYENWDDFLIKNNCIDKEGNPNISVWINDEYQRLFDTYENKIINENNVSKGISR